MTSVVDPIVQKIIYLLAAGWPTHRIVAGIMLWRDIPFTTDLVEQAHGSGASLMLAHKSYCERTLRCRAVIHMTRSIINPDPHNRKLAALHRLLQLEENRIVQASAFRTFYKEKFPTVARSLGVATVESTDALVVMARAREMFDALPRRVKQAWVVRGVKRKETEQMQIQANCQLIRQDIMLLERRHAEWVSTFGLCNHLTSSCLDSVGLQGLLDCFNSTSASTVNELKHGALTCPPLLSEEHQVKVMTAAQSSQSKLSTLPWWARHFALHRDLFLGTAVACLERDAEHAYMFVLGIQRPLCAIFWKLRRREVILPAYETLDPLMLLWVADRRYEWDILPMACYDEQGLPFEEDDDLVVFHGLRYSDHAVFTNHSAEAFEDFVSQHPPLKEGGEDHPQARGKVTRPSSEREKLKQEFPWLKETDFERASGFDRPRRLSHKRKADDLVSHSSDSDVADSEKDADDDVDSDCLNELDLLREHYEADNMAGDGFVVKVLGGKWTKKNIGVAADRVATVFRGDFAKTWCQLYDWPKMMSWSFAKYGQDAAYVMAREAQSRGEFFFRLWANSEDEEDVSYTEEDVAGYTEQEGFLSWLVAQLATSVPFTRALLLRDMVPQNY